MSGIRKNARVLKTLKPGDAVAFKRGVYWHWALYIGNYQVIHLTGDDPGGMGSTSGHIFTISGQRFQKARVKLEYFLDVAEQSEAVKKERKPGAKDVAEIIKTAMSMLGPVKYNLLTNNCEHFVKFCIYGKKRSFQAEKAGYVTAAASAVGFIAAVLVSILRSK